jgi:hypothetical protein
VSSTKRGRERNRADNYPTPAWCVTRFLEAVTLPSGVWLEPCAGDGAIIRAVNAMPGRGPNRWDALELRAKPMAALDSIPNVSPTRCDALKVLSYGNLSYSVAISNPPFSLAQEFIDACRGVATQTVMLLRLNFLASEKRHFYMTSTRPDVYVLPNRPSFVGGGKTDSIEYAWFHWHPHASGKLRILALTPALERIPRRRRK